MPESRGSSRFVQETSLTYLAKIQVAGGGVRHQNLGETHRHTLSLSHRFFQPHSVPWSHSVIDTQAHSTTTKDLSCMHPHSTIHNPRSFCSSFRSLSLNLFSFFFSCCLSVSLFVYDFRKWERRVRREGCEWECCECRVTVYLCLF